MGPLFNAYWQWGFMTDSEHIYTCIYACVNQAHWYIQIYMSTNIFYYNFIKTSFKFHIRQY